MVSCGVDQEVCIAKHTEATTSIVVVDYIFTLYVKEEASNSMPRLGILQVGFYGVWHELSVGV
jgi:hypothetical protein